ncbi:MAG: co-chaperone GroES family protein [Gammaproteobacteria bacterium]|nr:co-chaperone GroES family protein [Gammaproteobacteria bacterium]
MKAINDYIVIEKVKGSQKKVSGLILTDDTDSDNRYKKAKVVSVGNLAEMIKEGTMVMYDKHAGHDISYNDVMYRVIKLRDVVLVE